jgi:EPS-associated MarR family transcriptional regulator
MSCVWRSKLIRNPYNRPISDRPSLAEQHPAPLPIVRRRCGSVPKISHMTSRRSQLQEDTYFRVLRMLQENPDLTQREIAERLGVSTSGLNYCLKALIAKGWVKVQNFSESKNKFGYIYVLTPQGMAEKALLTGRFIKRKMAEYESLKAEIDALKTEEGISTAP